MKTVVLTLLALSLVIVPQVTHAVEGEIRIGPSLGFTLPSGDLGDQAGSGFAIGVTGDYGLRNGWSVGGDIIFNPYGGDEIRFGDSTLEYDWSVLHITGHGKYVFQPQSDTPFFATAILGLYRGSVDVTVRGDSFFTGGDTSSTELGLGLGGGVETTVFGDKTLVGQATFHFGDFDFFMIGASLLFGVGN